MVKAVDNLDNRLELLRAGNGDVRCVRSANKSKLRMLEEHRVLGRTAHAQLKLKRIILPLAKHKPHETQSEELGNLTYSYFHRYGIDSHGKLLSANCYSFRRFKDSSCIARRSDAHDLTRLELVVHVPRKQALVRVELSRIELTGEPNHVSVSAKLCLKHTRVKESKI